MALAGRCWACLAILVLLAGCQSASSASSRDAAASGLDGASATPDMPVTTDETYLDTAGTVRHYLSRI
jgi:outer membrane lipoprotein-sorting protein